ncbi:MAG: PEP/pyruvate-binding domain-containing protein [Alphaproteobacteria bacterium]|jgi:pyruvate,water dikinase|nr:PEP/pyruvate-binding domain-containing protein [Alphaproteobacteria bacterium]
MTADPFILWLDQDGAPGNALLGGKFANLAEMMAAGFAVPAGFGVTTAAYRHFMSRTGLETEAARVRQAAKSTDLSKIKELTADLVKGIQSAALPGDLEEAVRSNYAALEEKTGRDGVPVAVRSSGESEDLAGASFAGQYDTYLWISGTEAVLRDMRGCWASMFGEAVLSYRHEGADAATVADAAICVGIQQMVEARAAGVMFTLDPLNGDRSKIVMEGCWGLGEGVVKGDVTPDRFTIDKVTFEIIKKDVAAQPEEYRFDPATGAVALLPVEPERRDAVCITDAEALELARLAKHIEERRGGAQDIEWAVDEKGAISVLQVRPETVWSQRQNKGQMSKAKSPIDHVLQRLSGVRVATTPSWEDKP